MNNTTNELALIVIMFLLGVILHIVVFTFVFTDGVVYHAEKCSSPECSGDCINI